MYILMRSTNGSPEEVPYEKVLAYLPNVISENWEYSCKASKIVGWICSPNILLPEWEIDCMLVGTGAASAPIPLQKNAQRPNGTRCKPLPSKSVNDLYSSLQLKVLVTGLPNLKAPTWMANIPTLLPEVSIRKLELAFMSFVGQNWSTLLVWTSPRTPLTSFLSSVSLSQVEAMSVPKISQGRNEGWG